MWSHGSIFFFSLVKYKQILCPCLRGILSDIYGESQSTVYIYRHVATTMHQRESEGARERKIGTVVRNRNY